MKRLNLDAFENIGTREVNRHRPKRDSEKSPSLIKMVESVRYSRIT